MGLKDKKKAEAEETLKQAEEQSAPRDADFSSLDGEAQPAEQPASQEAPTSSDAANSELAKLKAEIEENRDKYLRALAEFENYKKRALKERSELLKYQGERIIFDLLEVLDNLEWALSHPTADAEKLKAGLELIHKLFVDVLGRWEIRASSAVGKDFDPVQHQAISKVAVDDSKPGTVLSELKKAYYYKDKLLRPGDVVVAVGKEAAAESASAATEEPNTEQGENGASS